MRANLSLKKTNPKLQLYRIFIEPNNPYQPPAKLFSAGYSQLFTLTLLGVPTMLVVVGFGKHLLSLLITSSWASFFELIIPTLTLVSAIFVSVSANPMYSLLALLSVFFNVVLLYIGSSAAYLGLVVLIIYAGAVSVLFLFVLMLFNVKAIIIPNEKLIKHLSQILAILGSAFLYVQLQFCTIRSFFVLSTIRSIMPWEATSAEAIAYYVQYVASDITALSSLYTEHGFLFAAITMVILSALLGAIVLATATTERATGVYDACVLSKVDESKLTINTIFLFSALWLVLGNTLGLAYPSEVSWGLNFFILGSSKVSQFITHQIFPRLRMSDFIEDTTDTHFEPSELETFQYFRDRRSDLISPHKRSKTLWRWRSARARNLYRVTVPVRRRTVVRYRTVTKYISFRKFTPSVVIQARHPNVILALKRTQLLSVLQRHGKKIRKYYDCRGITRRRYNSRIIYLKRSRLRITSYRRYTPKTFKVSIIKVRSAISPFRLGLFGFIRAFWRTRTIPWFVWWSWRVNAFCRNFIFSLIIVPHIAAIFYWFWSDYGIAVMQLVDLYENVQWYFISQIAGFSQLPYVLQTVLPVFFLWSAAALNLACLKYWWIIMGAVVWADYLTNVSADRTQLADDFDKSCNSSLNLATTFVSEDEDDEDGGRPIFDNAEDLAWSKRHPDADQSDSEGSTVILLALSGSYDVTGGTDCVSINTSTILSTVFVTLIVATVVLQLGLCVVRKVRALRLHLTTVLTPVLGNTRNVDRDISPRDKSAKALKYSFVFLLTPPKAGESFLYDYLGGTPLHKLMAHIFDFFYGPTTFLLFLLISAALLNSLAGLFLCIFWKKIYPPEITRGWWPAVWYAASTTIMLHIFVAFLLFMPPFRYTYHLPILNLTNNARELTALLVVLSIPCLFFMYHHWAYRLDTREAVIPKMFGERVWLNYAVSRVWQDRVELQRRRAMLWQKPTPRVKRAKKPKKGSSAP